MDATAENSAQLTRSSETLTFCPLCAAELPAGARECPRCDWVVPEPPRPAGAHRRAFLLSVVPGLGHAYKGQFVSAALIFVVGNLVVLPLAIVIAPGTLGVSVLLIPLYAAGVMIHAFFVPDLRADEREKLPTKRLDLNRAFTEAIGK
jgi:hypothetical protein